MTGTQRRMQVIRRQTCNAFCKTSADCIIASGIRIIFPFIDGDRSSLMKIVGMRAIINVVAEEDRSRLNK